MKKEELDQTRENARLARKKSREALWLSIAALVATVIRIILRTI